MYRADALRERDPWGGVISGIIDKSFYVHNHCISCLTVVNCNTQNPPKGFVGSCNPQPYLYHPGYPRTAGKSNTLSNYRWQNKFVI
ncbi:hypothetical protein GDO86_004326 [Hymenochirus boettgeri]|uniref:Uncharacterized protein n=1 Tax=Hymenochirus boettgeri TaxID=247094 RepID=A0A8T2K4R2_9PIPI|nr:hypothetical protein GDO86_004326 [Hymenochirus boettgeri]